ncbi:uncharacterized protein LOC114538604 [Dendronephthya gigantea]|uniref:uncharacterized protein LOC114538604 n=1 Tax=Dendronephthya gigantea TaxID=151771 RepID=UPI00106B3148|nr:uncharacterized protein LOC114538604 [Dendronephthya gigantea]
MSDPVSWAKPMITCTHKFQINLYKVEPNVKSPQRFPAGLNNIKYNFTLYGGKTVSCTILVYVRSCNSSEKEEIAERNGNKRDCKKDILVLWDISNYVNSAYIDVLKEFLKKFIKSEKLRVEEQGTHLGFASFSSDNRTRELLEVGEIKNKTLLMQWLDRIDFENNPSVNTAFKNMAKNVI